AQEAASLATGAPPADRSGLVTEYLFDSATNPLQDTAGHDHRPFSALPVSKKETFRLVEETRHGHSSTAIEFTSRAGKDHGLRIPLKPEIASFTQGDFTVEACFATTDPGRGILLGNYGHVV